MNPIGQRALRFYLAALRFFWTPLLLLARFVARHPILVSLGILAGLGVAFVLKTGGVWLAADLGYETLGRIAIVTGGAFDLAATVVTSAVGALILYWFLIAVGMVQIPVGEIMEVFRELGQMLRLQDPVKKDNEGNIRAINTDKLLQWGMLLLIVPGMALMSTVWLAAFPHWAIYAMLLLISGGGLAYGVFAAVRGRKVGAGIDLLLGMNGYLVVGGIITLLSSMVLESRYPRSAAVVQGGAHALTGTGLPWDNDWQLASYLAEVANHGGFVGVDIMAYPGALGALFGIGFIGLLTLVLHIATIVALWRILRTPPEHERKTATAAVPAGVTVSGTAGRGEESGGDGGGLLADAWMFLLIGAFIVASVIFLASLLWPTNLFLCQASGYSFIYMLAAVLFLGTLLVIRGYSARLGNIVGWVATAAAVIAIATAADANWERVGGVCRTRIAAMERNADSPRSDPPPRHAASSESPPPSRRSDPAPARPADDGRIAAYFAEHSATCPQTAARPWHRLLNARAACELEANRRDHPTIFATTAR